MHYKSDVNATCTWRFTMIWAGTGGLSIRDSHTQGVGVWEQLLTHSFGERVLGARMGARVRMSPAETLP